MTSEYRATSLSLKLFIEITNVFLLSNDSKRGVSVIWQKSPYAIDVLSRHATALQATKIGQMHSASMNKATAKKEEVNTNCCCK
jgi:hypothetical protein